MRKLLLVFSVLLLGLTWSVAQNAAGSQNSDASAQSNSASGSTSNGGQTPGQTPRAAGGQMTVEGCLSGSNGNFTLTDKNGTSYQLTGDTAKLSAHVGHEVKVTGSSASAGEGASGSAETSAAGSAGETLHVTSLKHISKTCKSGNSGMSH
ncbi:MAG TPA: DUF5818 domain-containing protein [Candidatus Sulfotelmatobacter sp.]|nr:DUF5818 domain-containing protein [Candidatus Sulfotelmatobacter sp.]